MNLLLCMTFSYSLVRVKIDGGSKKFLSDCGGGCAALVGVISGINVSKTQGSLVGAAFYASHISHQATILVPVTAFVAGQKAVNTIHSAFFQEKPCHE